MTKEETRDLLTRGGRRTSEEEIRRFLEAYEAGIPIMPVTFFCDFLETWARVAGQVPHPVEPSKSSVGRHGELDNEHKWRSSLRRAAAEVFLAIRKSNLLWRMIYGGEKLRTRPCPIHEGRWSGCTVGETECKGACLSGINVTGWLPEPGDEEGTQGPLFVVRAKPPNPRGNADEPNQG